MNPPIPKDDLFYKIPGWPLWVNRTGQSTFNEPAYYWAVNYRANEAQIELPMPAHLQKLLDEAPADPRIRPRPLHRRDGPLQRNGLLQPQPMDVGAPGDGQQQPQEPLAMAAADDDDNDGQQPMEPEDEPEDDDPFPYNPASPNYYPQSPQFEPEEGNDGDNGGQQDPDGLLLPFNPASPEYYPISDDEEDGGTNANEANQSVAAADDDDQAAEEEDGTMAASGSH